MIQFVKLNKWSFNLILLCCTLNMITLFPLFAQQKIRVQGVIKSIPGGKPIDNVDIIHNDFIISNSDIDGKFVIIVPRDGNLRFRSTGFNDINISVDGRQVFEVHMTERILEMEEITVFGEFTNNKLTVEPTDIEVKGNYFYLKTKFKIPTVLFKTDCRYIAQPAIYDVTKQETYYLRPVVIDGNKYDIIQDRYLNFDKSKDKLAEYVVDYDITKNNNIYSYSDSMYFARNDINNDFRAYCYLAIVSFEHVKDYIDSITIANGTVNPARFFNYSLRPMNLDTTPVSSDFVSDLNTRNIDNSIKPYTEMVLDRSKGLISLEFGIDKYILDYDNPVNKKGIDNMINTLVDIYDDENVTIKSISMVGYASPDGNDKSNKILANKRVENVFKMISETIPENALKYISFTSKGIVHPWSKVEELIKQDTISSAKKLREIVKKGNINDDQWRYRIFPRYRKLINKHYLTSLRQIEYVIDYTFFRDINESEILVRYKSGKLLSRYEYFRLISTETDSKRREAIEYSAIRDYPDFTWVVNRIAIRYLFQDIIDLELQKPALARGAPMSMVYNQAIMALKANDPYLADSLINTIEDVPELIYVRAVIDVLNGDYKSAFPIIAPKGGLNEVLLLLGLNYNKQAYDKMKIYMQDTQNTKSAKAWYVYAICANRVLDLTYAMISMRMALQLDSSLAEIAIIDSDIMDIYELVKPQDKEMLYE